MRKFRWLSAMRMIRTGTLNLKEHDSSKFIVK